MTEPRDEEIIHGMHEDDYEVQCVMRGVREKQMTKATEPLLTDEQRVDKITEFIKRISEDGCPPSGDCENYKVGDGSVPPIVDCNMCFKEETKKLLNSLGYLSPEQVEELRARINQLERHLVLVKAESDGYASELLELQKGIEEKVKEEQDRILNYLEGLLQAYPTATLAETIGMIKAGEVVWKETDK